MEKFLSKMQDLLDVQDLTLDSTLSQYEEWDSLTRVALVSFAQKHYQINITLDELNACESIKDIYNLFNKTNGGGGINKTLINSLIPLLHSYEKLQNAPYLKVA